jgi:hypothetical protein
VNGTYVDTNVSATTFTAAGAPDTSGFGSIAGSPIAQFYAVTKDVHIGPNSYGAPLTQANAVGFTASNADTTATNVSSLMATPFIATYAMMAPQASHLKPGYGAMYWATTGRTSTTAGSWRGLWNNNGVSATTFPVTDLEASATSVTDASYFNGSVILQPQGSTRATPAAGYSNFALRANSKNFYINQDDASGSQCGIANAACIDPNSTQPFVIKNLPASAGSGGIYLCIDANHQVYAASGCPSGSSIVTSFNTRTGAVTLSSSDVTTALGFTPATKTTATASGVANITTSCTSTAVPSGGGTPTITCTSTDSGHTHLQQ